MLLLQDSNHSECIVQEIGAAFRGEHPTDLLIVCNDNEIIHAHKLILAGASPLIRMLLKDSKVINEAITTIHFPDISAYYFWLLLDFLYLGEACVPTNDMENLHDLLVLLQMSNLKNGDLYQIKMHSSVDTTSDLVKREIESLSDANQVDDELVYETKDEVIDWDTKNAYNMRIDAMEISSTVKPELHSPEPNELEELLLHSEVYIGDFKTELFLSDSPAKSPSSQQSNEILLGHSHHKSNNTNEEPPENIDTDLEVAEFDVQTSSEKAYKCQYCNKQFNYLSTLTTHERIHMGDKPYACRFCDSVFTQKYNLISHITYKHRSAKNSPVIPGQFICCFCSVLFRSRHYLTRHIAGYHFDMINRYAVDTKYQNQPETQVSLPENKYTNECRHRCEQCNKTFTRKANLRRHYHLHTGEKPYTCRLCDATFIQYFSVILHIFSKHRNVIRSSKAGRGNRYRCCFCSGTFEMQKDLRRHICKQHKNLLLNKIDNGTNHIRM